MPLFSTASTRARAAIVGILVLILLALPLLGISQYYMQVLIGVFVYIIMTGSLRLVSLSGQISLGHAGLMSVGAYTSAILSKNLGWSPWLTIVLGTVLTFVISFAIAIPFSRLRGLYFTMVSLFLGMAIISLNQIFDHFTGGQSGLSGIPKLFDTSPLPYYYSFAGLMLVCLLIMHRLEFSRIGLTWKAVAQSHQVASSIGIHESRQRVICFAIGGLFAGLAGAAYSHSIYMVLSITTFSFFSSIFIFVYMMVGGVGSFYGPVIGTAAILMLQTFARSLKEYVPFIPAAILLVVLFLMPQGLAGLPDQFIKWAKNIRNHKTLPPVKEAADRAS